MKVVSKFHRWEIPVTGKKQGGKFFSDFLENGVEFWHSVYASLRRSGLSLQISCKNFGDFLKTSPPEGTKFFHMGPFKGSLELYR